MRIWFLLPFLLLANQPDIFGQEEAFFGFEVAAKLKASKPNEKLDLVIISDHAKAQEVMENLGISAHRYFQKYYRLWASQKDLLDLSEQLDFVVESGFGQAQLLNDTMRVKNDLVQVHQGDLPLDRPYKGKNVILGFIDSGIDFTHPDFQDSTGKTRVMKIWEQGALPNIPSRIPTFGYGQVWDSSDINSGNCPHDDDVLSHGTNVAGIAAGNGLALNKFKGAAPEAGIIYVASNFNASNWLQTAADGVEYIFQEAEKLGQPCVINISAGEYLGSHDGLDLAALRIDSMIKAKRGRAVVAAAGNSGNLPYHLGYDVSSDTNFTWFEYNPSTYLGYGAVYYQLWSDTADFNQVDFAFGANMKAPSFTNRGTTSFDDVSNRLNVLYRDSIVNGSNVLAYVETYATLQGSRYMMEVHIKQPDSSQYYYSLITTGQGRIDVWSDAWLGTSHIYQATLPTTQVLPDIIFYKKPDSLQTIVSSFTCLPSVLTVGNYTNRNAYLDYYSVLQTFPVIPGQIAVNSSKGPNRLGYQKPELSATGNYTLTSNRLASIPLHIANNQSDRIAQGGMHKRNGGTSMAAPVVAGSVALLMERCGVSDITSIKQWLISNAKTDSLTGNVPNVSYGFGKVSAFLAMSDQNYTPSFGFAGPQYMCKGIGWEVWGPWGMNQYLWSNGDTTYYTVIDTAQTFFLETIDSNGCWGHSDTAYINLVDTPPKPVITKISPSELQSTPAYAYQWYRNDQAMPGETNQTLTLTQNGIYFVEVSDTNDCANVSDKLSLILFVDEIEQAGIKLFPNPSASGFFNLVTSEADVTQYLKILDVQGQICQQKTFRCKIEIDLSEFEKGLYLFYLEDETGQSHRGKLIYH